MKRPTIAIASATLVAGAVLVAAFGGVAGSAPANPNAFANFGNLSRTPSSPGNIHCSSHRAIIDSPVMDRRIAPAKIDARETTSTCGQSSDAMGMESVTMILRIEEWLSVSRASGVKTACEAAIKKRGAAPA